MGRLYDPTAGEILIDGRPLKEWPLEELRAQLGFVPQDVFLFSDSIRNNIAFSLDGTDGHEAQVEAAARTAQVHDNIVGFPKGYATQLGERGITLSGGQKQRVSIARAIVRRPRIMLFDDALSAVDTATEEAILQALRDTMQGSTKVIISHRISAIRDADQILVMEHGRMVESGTHAELLALGGRYAQAYEEQLLEEARSNTP